MCTNAISKQLSSAFDVAKYPNIGDEFRDIDYEHHPFGFNTLSTK